MRGGRSFVVLLVLAIAIGAYAYFVESKKDVSGTSASTKVFSIDSGKIDHLEVTSASGDKTTLDKKGSDWSITSPRPMQADQDAVSTIVSTLGSLGTSTTVDANPSSVKAYSLDPPTASVAFRLSGETSVHRLELGTKTATGSDLYARVEGQPKVFLVSASTDGELDRSTFDLRNKSVLDFAQDKADSLSLTTAGAAPIALVKKGDEDWRLASSANARADFSVVDGLVNQLSQAKMKAVAAEDGTADLKKYGLAAPAEVVTVGVGSTRGSLDIGAKGADGTYYARDESRPLVFTIESSLADTLRKSLLDLREKMLFEFRSFNALDVDIVHGGTTYTFVKEAAPASAKNSASTATDTWKETKPTSRDVDQDKLTNFFVDVANLKATSFVAQAPTSGDMYVFTVKFGDAKSPQDERVTFVELGRRRPRHAAGRARSRGGREGGLRQGVERTQRRHRRKVTGAPGRRRAGARPDGVRGAPVASGAPTAPRGAA